MFSTATAEGEIADGFRAAERRSALQRGPTVEDVRFLSGEVANMVWAVEHSVRGPLGEPAAGRDGQPTLLTDLEQPPLSHVRRGYSSNAQSAARSRKRR